MRILCLLAAFISFHSIASAEQNGLLSASLPPQWSIKYTEDGPTCIYILTHKDAKQMVFNFCKWLSPNKTSDIPQLLDMAMGSNKSRYTIQNFHGDYFSGTIAFLSESRGIHALFMFHDKDTIWNGMFLGSESDLKEVVRILKGLRLQG